MSNKSDNGNKSRITGDNSPNVALPIKRRKTGGRAKGTRNKITNRVRNWVADFICGKTDEIERDFELLEPKDRVIMFERLLPYVAPKTQAIDANVNFDALTDEQISAIVNELIKDLE